MQTIYIAVTMLKHTVRVETKYMAVVMATGHTSSAASLHMLAARLKPSGWPPATVESHRLG